MKEFNPDAIIEFSDKVDRLCDFLLAKIDKDGSDDVVLIQNLQADSIDLKLYMGNRLSIPIKGLSDFMKGDPRT